MRTLVDNTSLHSVLRCIHPAARGQEIDGLGLLQLGTQIVFCERILIGTYEGGQVAERTNDLCTELVALGVPEGAFEHIRCSESEWIRRCLETGAAFAGDFEDVFPTELSDLAATTPDFISYAGAVADVALHDLISEDRPAVELADIAAEASEQQAMGLVQYTFAACPELWRTVRTAYTARGGWSPQTTAALAILLRMYHNDALARANAGHYAPAVARGQLLRTTNQLTLERLQRLIAEQASELAGREIPVPSVARTLLSEANCDPRGVIYEAQRLRERAIPLREALSKATAALADRSVDAAFEFERQLRDVVETVRQDLGLSAAPTLRGAFDIQFIIGIPAPSMSLREASRWCQYRWKRRKIMVLTDLSKRAAFTDSEGVFKRFTRNLG